MLPKIKSSVNLDLDIFSPFIPFVYLIASIYLLFTCVHLRSEDVWTRKGRKTTWKRKGSAKRHRKDHLLQPSLSTPHLQTRKPQQKPAKSRGLRSQKGLRPFNPPQHIEDPREGNDDLYYCMAHNFYV